MTHGTADEVLTYASGQEAKTKLEKCGAQVEFFTFGGGHQITDEAAERQMCGSKVGGDTLK